MNIKKNLKSNLILKKAVKFYVMISLSLMLSMVAFSQGDGDPGDPDDTVVPVDGGVGILLAAGIGYGIKKIREARKAEQK